MDQTDKFDYLIEECSYNNKYNFINSDSVVDNNLDEKYFSCLVCDKYFQRKWETDQYQYAGAAKRTVVHFYAPEPLDNIACRFRVIQCCGCAEGFIKYTNKAIKIINSSLLQRACERNVWPFIKHFQQHVINVNLIPSSALTLSVSEWPWWIWLLIALALLLLLCLLLIPLLLFCCKDKLRKKTTAATSQHVEQQQKQEAIVRKDGEVSILPSSTATRPKTISSEDRAKKRIIYRTPSESPSESAQSNASHSRNALMIRQHNRSSLSQDAQRGIANTKVLNSTDNIIDSTAINESEQHWQHSTEDRRRQNQAAIQHYRQTQETQEQQKESYSQNRLASSHSDAINRYEDMTSAYNANDYSFGKDDRGQQRGSLVYPMRQRSTSQERFFQKSDRQRGIIERGYDQSHLTFTTQKNAKDALV
ncbi:unnamed protein product [Anisakis simplex]|uniref:Uncharacterized protein n=1 Tax=Anisakis simplex TaxID=6269 RepID=A0A0M3JYR3_ANISI|nr:unnamed protein product [Anisakis simplex]